MPRKISGSNKLSLDRILIIVLIVLVIVVGYYFVSKSNLLENFAGDRLVPSGTEASFVMFYADWCPHCQNAKPVVSELDEQLKENDSEVNNKKVKIIKVNCEEEKGLAKKYDISGYPTFKLLTGKEIIEYDGGVDKEQFMDFLKQNV